MVISKSWLDETCLCGTLQTKTMLIVFTLLVIFCDVTVADLGWDRFHPLEDFNKFLLELESNFTPSVKVSPVQSSVITARADVVRGVGEDVRGEAGPVVEAV